MRKIWFALGLLSLTGCPSPAQYRCEQDEDCERGGVAGVCGADSTCSYPGETDARDIDADDVLEIDAPPPSPRSLCLEGPAMGPHPDACVATVCAANPACCALGWDRACVQAVETSCTPSRGCSAMAVFPTSVGLLAVPSDGTTNIVFEVLRTGLNYAAVADHDGDGDGDLAYVTDSGWGVLNRTAEGLVDAGSQTGVNQFWGTHVAWADHDLDGDLDVFVAARLGAGTAGFIVLNDRGTFVAQSALVSGDDIMTADWGDLDGDGDLDLITGDVVNSRRLRVHRNDRTMGFTSTSLATPTFVGSEGLRLCQLAGSPLPELVTAGHDFLRIYANSNGGFAPTPLLAVNPAPQTEHHRTETHCGDFDNDGDLDILVGGNFGTSNEIYRNDGGTFAPTPVWTSAAVNGNGMDIGDIDGDGKLDLAIVPEYRNAVWFRNTTTAPTAAITFALPVGMTDRDPPLHRGIDLAPRPSP